MAHCGRSLCVQMCFHQRSETAAHVCGRELKHRHHMFSRVSNQL